VGGNATLANLERWAKRAFTHSNATPAQAVDLGSDDEGDEQQDSTVEQGAGAGAGSAMSTADADELAHLRVEVLQLRTENRQLHEKSIMRSPCLGSE
jgi:hypothetical protein